jgi:hypothetical protein
MFVKTPVNDKQYIVSLSCIDNDVNIVCSCTAVNIGAVKLYTMLFS